ncbi:hypothetical protein LKO27_14130 [Tessaracoccus sp. OS52]|uniref:hypothetical protein n=1 Tax=Tessaracoccus sp. OS52 TaxID=2886691 RepID=UPI001D122833|nr:hypothetical protein [Tessaracoccus sp. OS52]MCC2594540.1 hypothetical protein [Tessaracoccus sp. OS52]
MRKLSKVMVATIMLIALAVALAAVQLMLLAMPLAAAAVVALGGAIAVMAFKVHVSSATSRSVERRVKLLTTARSVPSAAPVVNPPAPVGSATPAPPPAPTRTTAEKLRTVGTYTPQKVAAESTAGRVAASVTPDPDAPYRLFAATHGMGNPDTSAVSRRVLALVGSDRLAAVLADAGDVHRLHPGVSAAEIEHAQPSALIIEEDALNSGPWVGAVDPHGSKLLLELRVAMAWMRRNSGSIFVIPATGAQGLAATAMRADTITIDREFIASLSPEDPPSLYRTLAQYAAGGTPA